MLGRGVAAMGFAENHRPVQAILGCRPGDGPQTFGILRCQGAAVTVYRRARVPCMIVTKIVAKSDKEV